MSESPEIQLLREFLDVKADGNECRYDHHGYCQSHSLEKDCMVRRAAEMIEKQCGCGRCQACTYAPGRQPVEGDEDYLPG